MTEQDFKEISTKAIRMKVDLLMEEPCPIYEADQEDWEDFWYGEDISDDTLETNTGA